LQATVETVIKVSGNKQKETKEEKEKNEAKEQAEEVEKEKVVCASLCATGHRAVGRDPLGGGGTMPNVSSSSVVTLSVAQRGGGQMSRHHLSSRYHCNRFARGLFEWKSGHGRPPCGGGTAGIEVVGVQMNVPRPASDHPTPAGIFDTYRCLISYCYRYQVTVMAAKL